MSKLFGRLWVTSMAITHLKVPVMPHFLEVAQIRCHQAGVGLLGAWGGSLTARTTLFLHAHGLNHFTGSRPKTKWSG